ncbi:hypothetical protein [Haliscomenobacter sp.]|uniref:hypothetical protein n=1 Tax=Haliscomenobacter sp. TaxID=2717303 RepID=UPI0035938A56
MTELTKDDMDRVVDTIRFEVESTDSIPEFEFVEMHLLNFEFIELFIQFYCKGCVFEKIIFKKSHFTRCIIMDSKFVSCIFENCKIHASNIGEEFIDCKFIDCSFDESSLGSYFVSVLFQQCNFWNSYFFKCRFKNSQFEYCYGFRLGSFRDTSEENVRWIPAHFQEISKNEYIRICEILKEELPLLIKEKSVDEWIKDDILVESIKLKYSGWDNLHVDHISSGIYEHLPDAHDFFSHFYNSQEHHSGYTRLNQGIINDEKAHNPITTKP